VAFTDLSFGTQKNYQRTESVPHPSRVNGRVGFDLLANTTTP
jgi:hypothetical protein